MDISAKMKELFLKLDTNSKDKIRKEASEKFSVSVDTVKNHWLYSGNTPENNFEGVVNILTKAAENHVEEIQSLINDLKPVNAESQTI